MQTEAIQPDHPAGGEDFAFRTAGGTVALRATDDALTPHGGLVPWAAFILHTGIVEQLAETCPVKRTSPNAKPVHDILHSFRISPAEDLVPARPLAGLIRFTCRPPIRDDRPMCAWYRCRPTALSSTRSKSSATW